MPDTNLALQLNRFIGRETELAALISQLAAGSARLVTLTGAGGIGKTRLALEAAGSRLEAHPDGVWLVELAGIADPGRVPQAVADVFEMGPAPNVPVTHLLTNALRPKDVLLVLDNCEHLIAACAELAEALLRNCPRLTILATSREALGVPGESIWPVAPLTIPDFWRWPADGADASPAVLQYEAVRLFVDRAAHFTRGFALTNRNALAIAQICFGLDGLPLAIELAAARTRTLAVDQIAARLAERNRFRLLTSGSRTAAPRHQTLQAVIDWSYELLSDAERRVFEQLAVFANGWTLEAAEAVCAGETEVADLVARLVSKSLVQAEERDGSMRYRYLEIMRQYAAAKLAAAPDAAAIWRNYLHYCVHFAEAAEPKLRSAEQRAWTIRLEAEHDNLRAAWAWGLDHDPAGITRLAWALRLFWYRRGYLNQAQEWSAQLLTRVEPAQTALALNLAGTVANWQYNHSHARAYFGESLALAQAAKEQPLVAGALQGLGVAAMGLGELEAARSHLEQSLALFREQGNAWRMANVLGGLCVVLADQGDYAQARQLGAESLALYQNLGDRAGTAQPLLNLGELARAQGDYAAAADYYEQCLKLDTKSNQGAAMLNLGQVAVRKGQHRRAKDLLGASLAFYHDQNNAAAVATCLTGLAGILAAAGKPLPAAQLFGAVDEQWKLSGTTIHAADRTDYEYHLAKVQASLDPARFTQAQNGGRQLSLAQAIELAMTEVTTASEAAGPEPASREPPAPPELIIQGLGLARVWRAGRELGSVDWRYSKAKELLYFLLCQPPQTKEAIGLALWPDASPAQLRNNLGVTLHYLRRALGNSEWIGLEQDRYTFNRARPYQFDLETFEAALAEARRGAGEQAIASLRRASQQVQGDFLADMMESEWPGVRREALRRQYLETLLELGSRQLAAGQPAEASETYRTAIVADSYQEKAHQGLMRGLARLGEPGQALRHYQELAADLQKQLGAPPASETSALYERLKRGEAI